MWEKKNDYIFEIHLHTLNEHSINSKYWSLDMHQKSERKKSCAFLLSCIKIMTFISRSFTVARCLNRCLMVCMPLSCLLFQPVEPVPAWILYLCIGYLHSYGVNEINSMQNENKEMITQWNDRAQFCWCLRSTSVRLGICFDSDVKLQLIYWGFFTDKPVSEAICVLFVAVSLLHARILQTPLIIS